MTEREAKLISRLLDGQMLWEAAEAAGLSDIEAELTLMWTTSAYCGGHPIDRNHDLKTDELHRILRLFNQAADRDCADGKRRWCQFHLGWTESRGNPCGGCPCDLQIDPAGGLGRPRRYCDNACRQWAYRRRTADRQVT
ncbi:hypothetical protein ACFWPK_32700 [Nocardia sp. NPDC058519]|uniref:hypothetical protein n=1 Tax=Nocardia sp. NPDC058519 TaxID=3346535 RepID=UPI0036533F79